MAFGNFSPLVAKILVLLAAYGFHGRPFEGIPDYGYALLVAYLLLFGVLRERAKPILLVVGLTLLASTHFIPRLAIPEQQRILLDTQQNLIPPGKFLNNAPQYPYFLTMDGYLQGYKDKRLVPTIDIDEGIVSLRSGWINRQEYNFYPQVSSYVRYNLPFTVSYKIIPEMVGMGLETEGLLAFEKEGRFKIHDPTLKKIFFDQSHVGCILHGFGGQWDATGYNTLKIKLEKTFLYKVYDSARVSCFFFGFIALFWGLFFLRFTTGFGIQSFLVFISSLSLWLTHFPLFRWGPFARGGMDGIIHGGYPYWMLEKWASGDWKSALMSPEQIFYFMPGSRYIRFAEMFLFGDAYIFQVCFLIFVPVIFYRFFSIFLSLPVSFGLCLLTFIRGLNHFGLSIKLYVDSLVDIYGEGLGYSFLFIGLTLLAKSVEKVGWGIAAFFFFAISISIRPNLAIFVGIIGALHFLTTSFSSLPRLHRFIMLLGLSPILFIPLHNILGGEFVLLTKAATIKENLSLSPHLYKEGILYILGMNNSFTQGEKFINHFSSFYPHFILAWLGCGWLSLKGKEPVVRSIAMATFAGISMHFFYHPDIRYFHPYMTLAIVLSLSQVRALQKMVQSPHIAQS